MEFALQRKERSVEKEEERLWTAAFVAHRENKGVTEEQRCFFYTIERERERGRWIYSYGFVDVYWLCSGLQQSKQRKEVSLTLSPAAQITVSGGGVGWKRARFHHSPLSKSTTQVLGTVQRIGCSVLG